MIHLVGCTESLCEITTAAMDLLGVHAGTDYGRVMEIRLTRSDKLAAAPYADMAIVGHTPHGFTLEFVAIEPLMASEDGTVQGTVVARVKLPPSVIFQIASAIAENVDLYEKQFGPITARPRSDS